VLGLRGGHPVKLDCYDHYTTTDVISSFEQLKKVKKKKEHGTKFGFSHQNIHST